jgi:hypothetical protein
MCFLKLLLNGKFLSSIFALCWAYGWYDFLIIHGAAPIDAGAWGLAIVGSVPVSFFLFFIPMVIALAALLWVADVFVYVIKLVRH